MWNSIKVGIGKRLKTLSNQGILQSGLVLLFIAGFTFLDSILFHSDTTLLSWIPFCLAVILAILFTRKYQKMGLELIHKNELLKKNALDLEDTVTRRTEELSDAKLVLEQKLAEIKSLQSSLQEQAMRDPLTDLYNRRYMDEMLKKEFARAQRKDYPITIILFDIDFFKKLNDTYGHTAGDKVLENLGKVFSTHIRIDDYAIRYGGEEFLVVLPQVPYSRSLLRGNQIRQVVQQVVTEYNGKQMQVTISGGVAGFPDHGSNPYEVIARADEALYKAKEMGRNRIEVYMEGEMKPPFNHSADTYEV